MLESLQLKRHGLINIQIVKNKGGGMSYDEDALMETFDRWDRQERRQRFLRRMERKFYTKYRLVQSRH
jgi:hypothetical protein